MNERATPTLDEVLAHTAVRGTDPGAVCDYAMGLIAARSRRRRMAGGAAAVLAVMATTGFAVMGNSGPATDEVVTPVDSVTTTEAPARSQEESATTAPVSTVPATTIPVLTVPAVPTTTAGIHPPLTITPAAPSAVPAPPIPTAPVDRPGTGTLVVSSGVAGELLDLRFQFDDPDGPGVAPFMWIHTDEPGTVVPEVETGGAGSCSGGPGTTGRLHEPVQFASTGQRRVWVTVKYCNSLASVFSTTVDVAAPKFGDGPGRAVMAAVPGADETLAGATWQFRTDGGETLAVGPADDEITQQLEPVAGFQVRGVVIVLPAATAGELVLTTSGPDPRTYTGEVTLTSPGKPVSMQPLG